MDRFLSGKYLVMSRIGARPQRYDAFCRHAALVEEFDLDGGRGDVLFVGVGEGSRWPFLVVSLRFDPGIDAGFLPGVIVIPESGRMFLGAGDRILAYNLEKPERLWTAATPIGFWGWKRHEDVVLMSAELELSAFSLDGRRLWSRAVDPPWSYMVSDGQVFLSEAEALLTFPLASGPEAEGKSS